jgi:hypothetical protein
MCYQKSNKIQMALERREFCIFFIVLANGECNSTIDYFVMFYDIKAVVSSKGEYIIFLET